MSHSGSSPSASEAILRCEHVWKLYQTDAGIVHALKDIELTVPRAQFLCVRGASGSGKTTLLGLLGALDLPTSGDVYGLGVRYRSLSVVDAAAFRRKSIGFVFQDVGLVPHLDAVENVALPRLFDGLPWPKLRDEALSALDRVGLTHRREHLPRQLSSGERQRTAIARALISKPQILLADEPTASLDRLNVDRVLAILCQLRETGVTVVVATHDDRVERAADSTVVLDDGTLQGATARPSGGA